MVAQIGIAFYMQWLTQGHGAGGAQGGHINVNCSSFDSNIMHTFFYFFLGGGGGGGGGGRVSALQIVCFLPYIWFHTSFSSTAAGYIHSLSRHRF